MKAEFKLHINDILDQIPNTEGIWLDFDVECYIYYKPCWHHDGCEVEVDSIETIWPKDAPVMAMAESKARQMFLKEFWERFKDGQLDLGKKGEE